MKKVKVNNESCIGCGACAAIASEVFEFDDEGYAKAIESNNILDNMSDELKSMVMDAKEGCPTEAIVIEEI